MVGSVRIALVTLAACGGTAVPEARAPTVANRSEIGDVTWPRPQRPPDVPVLPQLDDSIASQVITQLGPRRAAALRKDALAQLVASLPQLRGNARLEALDRIAETADTDADEGVDEAAIQRKLAVAREAYTALLGEPGFARYARADQILFRAARILYESWDHDAGDDAIARLLEHYPRSPWIADAYVLRANDEADRNPAAARHDYDETIAIARPVIADYARFMRLHVLDVSNDYATALADAEQLARSETFREPAELLVMHAFAEIGDPADARVRFGAMDPAHLPTLLRLISDAYRRIGKYDQARAVLDDVVASSNDGAELCAAHARLFDLAVEQNDRTEMLRAAHAFVDATRTQPSCRIVADQRIGEQALSWQADELWELALAVVTTPEREVVELRDRAYLTWTLAARAHSAEAWRHAAAAFEAAFAKTSDRTLHAGAELARKNATLIRR